MNLRANMSNNSFLPDVTALPRESNRQKLNVFFAGLNKYKDLLSWLISFFKLTEQEQEDAGIDLCYHRYK